MKEIEKVDARRKLEEEFTRLKEIYADRYDLSFLASSTALKVCDAIDIMQRDGSAIYGFGYEVSPENSGGTIYADMSDAVMQGGRTHPFFYAIKDVNRLRFSAPNVESIRITFDVNDLWKPL